jgi:hypothetical protein
MYKNQKTPRTFQKLSIFFYCAILLASVETQAHAGGITADDGGGSVKGITTNLSEIGIGYYQLSKTVSPVVYVHAELAEGNPEVCQKFSKISVKRENLNSSNTYVGELGQDVAVTYDSNFDGWEPLFIQLIDDSGNLGRGCQFSPSLKDANGNTITSGKTRINGFLALFQVKSI